MYTCVKHYLYALAQSSLLSCVRGFALRNIDAYLRYVIASLAMSNCYLIAGVAPPSL
jgi:hypothetical protein